MTIRLRTNDPVPLYRQLIRQVRLVIAAGEWEPGSRIPSHRELSASLSVNPLTVKKAYDALVAEGLLESRAGLGTFVSSVPRRLSSLARPGRGEADRLLVDAVAAARQVGMSLEEFLRRAGDLWRMEKDHE